jgi:hypothetical protein
MQTLQGLFTILERCLALNCLQTLNAFTYPIDENVTVISS